MDREGGEKMKLLVFFGKFLLYITIMFLMGIPAIKYYISSPNHALNAVHFFTFYMPISLIPFLALVLATPIEKKKMIRVIAIGSLLILFFNILIIALQHVFLPIEMELFQIYGMGRIAFPLLLWFIFAQNEIRVEIIEHS